MSILKQKRLFNGGRSTRHSARFESSTSNFKLCHFTRSARKIRFQRQRSFDHNVSDDLEESTANLLVTEDKSLDKEIPKDQQGLSKRGRGMLRWEPSNFTGEELVNPETAFTKMDSDGNGTLSGVWIIFRISASPTLSTFTIRRKR